MGDKRSWETRGRELSSNMRGNGWWGPKIEVAVATPLTPKVREQKKNLTN